MMLNTFFPKHRVTTNLHPWFFWAELVTTRRREKDEPDEDDDGGNDVKDDPDGESGDEQEEEQNLLKNFRHRFEMTLREPARNLQVKELILSFDPSSIYGQRSGFLKGLMVTVA